MSEGTAISRREFILAGAVAAAAASGALAVGLPEVAHAQTTQSRSATYDGRQYNLVATAQKLAGVGLATGTISCAFSRPAGHLGVNAILYSGGKIISDKLLYSTIASSNMSSMASHQVSTETVQVSAMGYVWRTGSSLYSSFSTGKTPPARSGAVVGNCREIYPTNDRGLTYGSLYEARENGLPEPDLVEARGVNGVDGYIYADELRSVSEVSSPAEAVALMEKVSAVIPVYLVDGATVVDEFEVLFG